MKEYVVSMKTPGGSVKTEVFTNKRKAKSRAWKFVLWHKSVQRDKGADYGELRASIIRYYGDIDNHYEVIAYYD